MPLLGFLLSCTTVTDDGRAWTPPKRLDDGNRVDALFGVGLDANGTAMALWSENDGVLSKRQMRDGGWSSRQRIDDVVAPEEAFWPSVAVDREGNAVGAWRQEPRIADQLGVSVWSNRYTAGSDWHGAARLHSLGGEDASNYQVAMDSDANAIVIWQQSSGTCDDHPCESIWGNYSTSDGDWGTAELIEYDNRGHAGEPRVAMDSDGNAIAVWHQSDGTRVSIWANRFTPSQGWESARHIGSDDQSEARMPDVAMDPDGNAIVVWEQSDDVRVSIWANRFTRVGGWDDAEPIETNDDGDATNPRLGMDANGHAITVWNQFNGTTVDVWSNHYTPGNDWGTAELIERNDDGDALRPRVAVSASGDAVAVWPQFDGFRYDLWANAYSPSKGWRTAELVDPSDQGLGQPLSAEVAIDPDGNAVAVWLLRDPGDHTASLLSPSELWAARFE